MRKFIYLLFVSVFLSSVAFGQEKIYKAPIFFEISEFPFITGYDRMMAPNQEYSNYTGYEGEYNEETGLLENIDLYIDGKPAGLTVVWHENGQLAAIIHTIGKDENGNAIELNICYDKLGNTIKCEDHFLMKNRY